MASLLNMSGRALGGMNMDKYLIKTVTLDSPHEQDSIGNAKYWGEFLELPLVSDSSDMNLYIAVFEGNQATSYKTDFICYYRNSSSINCLGVRNNRKPPLLEYDYNTGWSYWASAGTVIKAYKIPAV